MTSPKLLHYKTFTPESELAQQHPPLIILHGLLGSMDNWRSQARRLSEFRPVITVDLRNHGQSPHLQGMSYREMYEDIIRLANHLNLERFDLLGHSMGGKVAMHLALARPEFIHRLIIVDIAPKPYPLWHQGTFQSILTAPVASMASRQEIDDYLKHSIEDQIERNFMIKNLKRSDSGEGFSWKINLEEITRGYLKIAGFTTAEQKFDKETLFIRGEDSHYIQDSDNALIKVLFPNSTIFSIKNSGHMPHFEQADEFFKIVNTFLSLPE